MTNLKQWNDGRRGQDGWGRYTRRRKWYRDAELVEISPNANLDGSTDTLVPSTVGSAPSKGPEYSHSSKDSDSSSSQARRRGFFKRSKSSHSSGDLSGSPTLRDDEQDTQQLPSHQERDGFWGVGDDARMGLE